jgi:glutaconate CoA-transferase, subunit A
MASLSTLAEAIDATVRDGHTVALEGRGALAPAAAAHEVIRQGRTDLTLVRTAPDELHDQLVGAGCAERLVAAWTGQPSVRALPRLRDAVEHGWPRPLGLEVCTSAEMAAAWDAGAAALPFGVLRAAPGADPGAAPASARVAGVVCPFTGEVLTAVRGLRPDVGIVHARRADRRGDVLLDGVLGVRAQVVLAARATVVTVDEVVAELPASPGGVVLPARAVDHVVVAPAPAPAAADPAAWAQVAADREQFLTWLRTHVLGGVAA